MRARSVRSILAALFSFAITCGADRADAAQAQTGTVRVAVVDAGRPVQDATVLAAGTSATTDASGVATLTLPAGKVQVVATRDNYDPAATKVEIVAGQEVRVRLTLLPKPPEQGETTVTVSTRINRRLEDQPLPIEVLDRSTIENEMLMTPGNIAKTLDGMQALRLQNTSPELGTAMVRIQGSRGHYSRLLFDGVPLYFDHPGGLQVVQISPMDIGQVEVVPGSASALFGANAVAGAVNLISRKPGVAKEREFLFSQSFQGGTDGVLWLSSPATGSWSSTYLFGGHYQDERDVDDDGWSDIPGYARGTARTRVLWDNRQGRSASGTAGVVFEEREGGSAFAHQNLKTKGADGALFGQMPFRGFVLAGAGTLFVQSRTREFGDGREHERREGATIELTLRGTGPRQTWIAGVAADWYALRSSDPIASKYSSTRPGIFFYDDVAVSSWLTVSGGARIDHDIKYGYFLSPRGSALVHGGPWAARVSAGRSFYSPLPLTEETDAAGLTRLTYIEPTELESARSLSADLSHTTQSSTIAVAVFHTHVDDPALVDRATYTYYTDDQPVVTRGVQLLAGVRRGALSMTGTYVYTKARERGDVDIALTPRHTAGFVAAADSERHGRIGLQVYFTGEQRLDANPFRTISEPYTVVNLQAERPFGRVRVFVNAQNVGDVRQTNWDPIARPARDVDGRWTVDAWAPLAGRLINLGLKVAF
ncbi:MAG TPA: TonB-dependent receptor [Vicinamibacterales bacterium]|nr:TonB-dependent receptor [Vicinamibacterales bacterium]